MRQFPGTLRSRLLISHLVVVAISIAVLIFAGRQLASAFVRDHLRSMGRAVEAAGGNTALLEEAVGTAFNQALLWAALLGAVAALAAATYGAVRVLRPLDEVRRVTRRLATGSYLERVAVPQDAELAALARDVNELAEALEKTEERRLRLIAEVAHELRTPVATLKGYLEGLLDGVFEPDPETLAASIREARRMERLAEDLGNLSRAEEGRVELHREMIDLNALTSEVAERLRPQFDDQDVGLTVNADAELLVDIDRDRIAQVLTNLIGNALGYTPDGGKVGVTTQRRSGSAEVIVTDTGRGLSPEQTEMVFDRFYRADRSTRGTGIGLTIARSLARLHGGDVTASSPGLGKGATFTMTLPLSGKARDG